MPDLGLGNERVLVVVTGAGRGFGKTLVRAALARSLAVLAMYRSSFTLAPAPDLVALQADCSLATDVDRIWPRIAIEIDRSDHLVLVNNAGWYIKRPFMETTLADISATVDSNVRAAVNVTRRFSREPKLSTIVNIVSTSAIPYSVPRSRFVGKAAYGGSKTIESHIVESLVGWLPPRVRVFNLYPRNINTWSEEAEPDSLDAADLASWILDAVAQPHRWHLSRCIMLPVR